jgi:peptidoglycan/LPS O-acetylase OafA/YrhL
MPRAQEADRLSPLDALRGLAALAVAVFSHYVHFGGDRSSYPFDKLAPVHWLYANSWLMVDLFFVLTGSSSPTVTSNRWPRGSCGAASS